MRKIWLIRFDFFSLKIGVKTEKADLQFSLPGQFSDSALCLVAEKQTNKQTNTLDCFLT